MNSKIPPFSTGIGGNARTYSINGITYIAETRFPMTEKPLDDRLKTIICSSFRDWTENAKDGTIAPEHLCLTAGKED